MLSWLRCDLMNMFREIANHHLAADIWTDVSRGPEIQAHPRCSVTLASLPFHVGRTVFLLSSHWDSAPLRIPPAREPIKETREGAVRVGMSEMPEGKPFVR